MNCASGDCGQNAAAIQKQHPYFNPYLLDPNEFICDGGDQVRAARARISDEDRPFSGIEPEDTVVRYTTDAGDTLVQPSNKVCVYA